MLRQFYAMMIMIKEWKVCIKYFILLFFYIIHMYRPLAFLRFLAGKSLWSSQYSLWWYVLNMHHNIMENNKEHYMTCLRDLSMHDKWSSIWLIRHWTEWH
jgi:hypothetical protein